MVLYESMSGLGRQDVLLLISHRLPLQTFVDAYFLKQIKDANVDSYFDLCCKVNTS
jgi:hypothetical protein